MRKRLFTQKTIYILCFMALNLIDLLRTTQNGDIWQTAANCTGLAVMILIAGAYPIKTFLSVFSYIWTGICACAAVAAALQDGDVVLGMYKWIFVTAVLNVWWLLLFYKCLVIPKIKAGKALSWINILGVIWLLLTVFMTFNVSGRFWQLWYLAMFALFYATGYSEDAGSSLVEAMVDGTILSFFAIQIYAYGFRPYDRIRYAGAYLNYNSASLYYLIVYVMVLFKLHLLEIKKAGKWRKLFFMIGASGLLCFMFLTMGRTSWVTAFLVTLLYGVLIIRKRWQKKWGAVAARGAALCVGAAILFPLVFGTVRWLPTILHHPIWYEGEYSPGKVHSYDPANSPKYTELDEFLDSVFSRIWNTFRLSMNNPFVLKAQAAELQYDAELELAGPEGMDQALRERITFYKAYLENLSWLGHSSAEGHYRLEGSDYFSWHAQNVWIQMAYYYGIPAGVCFLVLSVIMILFYAKKSRNQDSPYAAFPLFICVVFFVYGLMEDNWEVGQYSLFLLFFVQHPGLFGKGEGHN